MLLWARKFHTYSVRCSGLLTVAESAKNGHRIVTKMCSQTSAPISPPRQWTYGFGEKGWKENKKHSLSKCTQNISWFVFYKKPKFGKINTEWFSYCSKWPQDANQMSSKSLSRLSWIASQRKISILCSLFVPQILALLATNFIHKNKHSRNFKFSKINHRRFPWNDWQIQYDVKSVQSQSVPFYLCHWDYTVVAFSFSADWLERSKGSSW